MINLLLRLAVISIRSPEMRTYTHIHSLIHSLTCSQIQTGPFCIWPKIVWSRRRIDKFQIAGYKITIGWMQVKSMCCRPTACAQSMSVNEWILNAIGFMNSSSQSKVVIRMLTSLSNRFHRKRVAVFPSPQQRAERSYLHRIIATERWWKMKDCYVHWKWRVLS